MALIKDTIEIMAGSLEEYGDLCAHLEAHHNVNETSKGRFTDAIFSTETLTITLYLEMERHAWQN